MKGSLQLNPVSAELPDEVLKQSENHVKRTSGPRSCAAMEQLTNPLTQRLDFHRRRERAIRNGVTLYREVTRLSAVRSRAETRRKPDVLDETESFERCGTRGRTGRQSS